MLKRMFCCSKNNGVYRLLLKNNKIYIGKSSNIQKRLLNILIIKGPIGLENLMLLKDRLP